MTPNWSSLGAPDWIMATGELDPQHLRWAGERPSRCFDVAAGTTWWTEVDVVEGIGMANFGVAVRSMLESMYIKVRSWPYRNPTALRSTLDGSQRQAPFLVLGLHSSNDRLLFGTNDPTNLELSWGADELASFLQVNGGVVLNVGCNSAGQPLVDSFLSGGASAYIAPEAPPFAHSGAMFTSLVFFGLTQLLELEEAVERARAVHPELAMWRVFK